MNTHRLHPIAVVLIVVGICFILTGPPALFLCPALLIWAAYVQHRYVTAIKDAQSGESEKRREERIRTWKGI